MVKVIRAAEEYDAGHLPDSKRAVAHHAVGTLDTETFVPHARGHKLQDARVIRDVHSLVLKAANRYSCRMMTAQGDNPNPPLVNPPPSPATLFELSAFIYRDISLADAKAAFALTVAGLGIAGTASFYGSMPDPASRHDALSDWLVLITLFLGLLCAAGGIFCAIVTVLPRRYVGKNGPIISVTLREDALLCFKYNVPFLTAPPKSEQPTDGGSLGMQNIIAAFKSGSESQQVAALLSEIERASVVRQRKYWWVGPSLFCTLFAVIFFTSSLVLGARVVSRHGSSSVPLDVRIVK